VGYGRYGVPSRVCVCNPDVHFYLKGNYGVKERTIERKKERKNFDLYIELIYVILKYSIVNIYIYIYWQLSTFSRCEENGELARPVKSEPEVWMRAPREKR
jgi:hypothetical protein